MTNETRFNFSRNLGEATNYVDSFGGAVVPPTSVLFPPPLDNPSTDITQFIIASGLNTAYNDGALVNSCSARSTWWTIFPGSKVLMRSNSALITAGRRRTSRPSATTRKWNSLISRRSRRQIRSLCSAHWARRESSISTTGELMRRTPGRSRRVSR